MDHVIERLDPADYAKCSNIWDMEKSPRAQKWLEEIVSGNRIVFIYKIGGQFIGEAALLIDRGDPDYTIAGRRIYLSRMIVKDGYRNRGIGGRLIDFLAEYARGIGSREMSLGVDLCSAAARHLYEKKGFTEVLFEGEDEAGKFVKLLSVL